MPSPLTEAHIRGEKRIREVTVRGVERAWLDVPDYRDSNVPEFLARAVPVVLAGVRASANLTAAYLARAREEQPQGFNVELVVAGLRNGTPLVEVYKRPFVDVWTALSDGKTLTEAVEAGRQRAVLSAAMDPQLAMRDTARALDRFGYRRVADGDACAFCQEVDGAYVKGDGFVMALHNNCGCSLEPLTEPYEGAVTLPDGTQIRKFQYGPLNDNVAVRLHGELGPVLTGPGVDFTSLRDLP